MGDNSGQAGRGLVNQTLEFESVEGSHVSMSRLAVNLQKQIQIYMASHWLTFNDEFSRHDTCYTTSNLPYLSVK